ncbi:MAG: ATP synthase F0 subunit B [Desulfatiglans sp.]|jgi:F-type H+-transporting ATPase subunit b|nr:ATP synthase F0 subunit B [Desulfatiglans sp.]
MIPFKIRYRVFIAVLCTLFFIVAAPLYSSESTHPSANHQTDAHPVDESGHEKSHSSDRSGDHIDLLYRFINFGVLIVILVVVFRKARISYHFSARSEEIAKRIEDLKMDKEEVEKRYKEVEGQLKRIEEQSRDIIEQYRKEGTAEKERIISGAKERVRQILEQAETTIQREVEYATGELRQEILERASKRAQEILAGEIGEKEQEIMVFDFMEKMGRVK